METTIRALSGSHGITRENRRYQDVNSTNMYRKARHRDLQYIYVHRRGRQIEIETSIGEVPSVLQAEKEYYFIATQLSYTQATRWGDI